MHPSPNDFWFLPLGGTGEIGMNLNLYGHNGAWLMVDCGVIFEKVGATQPGVNRVEMADPTFISNRAESLVGLVATHAHEDHIGAIAHLWEQFRCPIYTTGFTRHVILRKLRATLTDAPIITVDGGDELELGPFRVKWLPITHSTPETNALLITTACGQVLHTADWKIDSAPIVGAAFAAENFAGLGSLGIDAIVCDSTNATRSGHSVSESELFEGLLETVRESTGRVVVSCFASNIARLQTLGNVAHVAGRHLGLLGASMQRMVSSAKASGYLQENFNPLNKFDLGYLPPEELMAVATGSQGETSAALNRLANDTHPDINLSAGDHVIFSATTIPGNEREVAALVRAFQARQIRVTHGDTSPRPLHASGHPAADELKAMYGWVKPRLAIPVHGEAQHMAANAAIAKAAGVPQQLVGVNGDLFDILAGKKQSAAASVGRLWLDEEKHRLHRVETAEG